MAPKSTLQEKIDHASSLLQNGRVADAERSIQSALEAEPESIEALYVLAVCQRF